MDYVLHFASPASPIDYAELPIHTMKVGSIGTLHTLGLAKEKGARYLLASTSETYGDPLVHPQPETYWGNVNPVGPRGVYDEAKRFAEALTSAYRRTHGVDTAIVRIFNTYGPRMRPRDGRAIPTFIRQALRRRAADRRRRRQPDPLRLLRRRPRRGAAPLPAVVGRAGPMNIGNPHEIPVIDIARRIKELTGSASAIEFIPRPEDDPTVRQPDIALARRALGWEPQVSLDDGLKRTIDWFSQHPDVVGTGR